MYITTEHERAVGQLERRRAAADTVVSPGPTLEVEVLLELIHGVRLPEPDAAKLVRLVEHALG